MTVLINLRSLFDLDLAAIGRKVGLELLDLNKYINRETINPKPFDELDYKLLTEDISIYDLKNSLPTTLNLILLSFLNRVSLDYGYAKPKKIYLFTEIEMSNRDKEILKQGLYTVVKTDIEIFDNFKDIIIEEIDIFIIDRLDILKEEVIDEYVKRGKLKNKMVLTPFRTSSELNHDLEIDDIVKMFSPFFKLEFLKPILFSAYIEQLVHDYIEGEEDVNL